MTSQTTQQNNKRKYDWNDPAVAREVVKRHKGKDTRKKYDWGDAADAQEDIKRQEEKKIVISEPFLRYRTALKDIKDVFHGTESDGLTRYSPIKFGKWWMKYKDLLNEI